MTDILSQMEIDSLINALSTGEIGGREEQQTAPGEAAVRVYDFRRPNKFSKEQMRTIQIINENFARILSNFLSAYLRTPVQIKVSSVSQVTFEEFIYSLSIPTLLTMFRVREDMGSAMLETNPQFTFPIIDLLFGGEGEAPKKVRELTEIEITVMKRVVNKVLENMRYAWEDVIEMQTQIENMETNPQFNQMLASNETVALITLTTHIRDSQGLINICFPYLTMEKGIAYLTSQHWFAAPQKLSPFSRQQVENNMEKIDVEITAMLGETVINVEDFLQFEKGDVILLDQKVDSPLTLMVEGKPLFKVQAGTWRGRKAVQLLSAVEEGENE